MPQVLNITNRFECITTSRVRNEFRTTTKFKDKYPWRKELAGGIKAISSFHEQNREAKRYQNVINNLVMAGTINERKERSFDLSKVDMELLAWALALESPIVSGDEEIKDFGYQEFDGVFKGMISPLEVMNNWLHLKLIEWNDTFQAYLEDWRKNEESSQPEEQRVRFEDLTGYTYAGS